MCTPRRQALLSMVHIAKLKLGMDEECYRGMLAGIAGINSCRDATISQLEKVAFSMQRILAHGALKAAGKSGLKVAPDFVLKHKGTERCSAAQMHYIESLWQRVARIKEASALDAFILRTTHTRTSALTRRGATEVIVALEKMRAEAGDGDGTAAERKA